MFFVDSLRTASLGDLVSEEERETARTMVSRLHVELGQPDSPAMIDVLRRKHAHRPIITTAKKSSVAALAEKVHTPWVATSVVSSVHPTLSAVNLGDVGSPKAMVKKCTQENLEKRGVEDDV